ncbi:hypothetical protein EB796_021857 [Bugula neritina]|uniref:Uncharacterized protein n=1 Tax=Bugula neritina TaxID=10212 RepID=A0A7J7J300_BUGNE|nr:hypothetical protein EB796_021857 [Bugula neritina]
MSCRGSHCTGHGRICSLPPDFWSSWRSPLSNSAHCIDKLLCAEKQGRAVLCSALLLLLHRPQCRMHSSSVLLGEFFSSSC